MPGVEIKRAIQQRLLARFGVDAGDGRLKHIETQYPRLSQQIDAADYPKVSISVFGHTEMQTAGGGSGGRGVKELTWEVVVHVNHLLADPLTDGDAWDQLLDDIEAELRRGADLTQATGSPYAFGNRLKRETLPPIRDEMRNAYYSNITFYVQEAINA